MKHYIIVLEGGSEPSTDGPYDSPEVRDHRAKSLWSDMKPFNGDNLFRASVDEKGELSVGSFLSAELGE